MQPHVGTLPESCELLSRSTGGEEAALVPNTESSSS